MTPAPLTAVQCRVAGAPRRGAEGEISIAILAGAAPVDAVVPLEVTVTDPAGRQAEGSGHYGAAGGRQTLRLRFASNDTPGDWNVRVRELASGLVGEATFAVRP